MCKRGYRKIYKPAINSNRLKLTAKYFCNKKTNLKKLMHIPFFKELFCLNKDN